MQIQLKESKTFTEKLGVYVNAFLLLLVIGMGVYIYVQSKQVKTAAVDYQVQADSLNANTKAMADSAAHYKRQADEMGKVALELKYQLTLQDIEIYNERKKYEKASNRIKLLSADSTYAVFSEFTRSNR